MGLASPAKMVYCSVLQFVAVFAEGLVFGFGVTSKDGVLYCVAVCCSLLQFVAVFSEGLVIGLASRAEIVCCSVSRFVAVRCNELQRVYFYIYIHTYIFIYIYMYIHIYIYIHI